MTNAVHNTGAAGGAKDGGAKAATSKGAHSPWRRLWQVPLLLAGLGIFGLGLRILVKTIKPVPFETHVSDVRNMLAAGKYNEAVARINVLAGHFSQQQQLGTLEVLAGDALYLAQQKQPAPVHENYDGIVRHYGRAKAYGFAPTATMNERWAEAALALGDAPRGIEKLEEAAAQDPAVLPRHVHELVAAYQANGQQDKALDAVERLLASNDLGVDDRAWGLCEKIRMALAAGDEAGIDSAVAEALAALPGMPELDPSGRVLLWAGRAEIDEGKTAAAKEHLTTARSHFLVHHLDDGRAGLLLGRLAEQAYQANGKPDDLAAAGDLFQEVVTRHAGTPLFAAALLGRAEVAALRNQITSQTRDTLLADYRFAIQTVREKKAYAIGDDRVDGAPEFITKEGVRTSLLAAYTRAADAGRLNDALTFLALDRELGDPETAADALRLAATRERRARELLAGDLQQRPAAIALLHEAAEDFARHSHLATMDDAVSGDSLWKAAGLFDEAGNSEKSAAIYEQFVKERPTDSRVPEGLLAMGRVYQSVGAIDKAIPIYQRNIAENGRTPAAYKSAVSLARCYMTQGPAGFEKAEAALLAMVQDNRDILPTANEFRESLFTLGELYFRNNRWADGILRLEEALERYPEDGGAPRATYMLAESYRHSAQDITAAITANPAIAGREEMEIARAQRYSRAMALFDKVIAALDPSEGRAIGEEAATRPALSPLEGDYLRTAYMDRAGCAYETGQFGAAIKLYDGIAARFPTEPLAVEAYVQIVNGYLALQQAGQATAAVERARWVLKRIPDEAFATGPTGLNRKYYEDFLTVAAPR